MSRKRCTRDEAEVTSRGQAIKKLGLIEIIKLLLMNPIKIGDNHKVLDLMICAKR